MCALTPEQQRLLEAQMATDSVLAESLAPLLDGRWGADVRELMLRCLARQLDGGRPVRSVLLLALADALYLAQGTESPTGSDSGGA